MPFLQLGSWLDVRSQALPPICRSVHIPLEELSSRLFELPSKRNVILVADTGPESGEAQSWLESIGREALLSSDYEFGERSLCRLWAPNRFLEDSISRIRVGRALDLACGSGRDSVYLASEGFEVTAVDHLQDALALGESLAARYLPQDNSINWLRADLGSQRDFGKSELITCFYYLNRGLLARVGEMLGPGGNLLIETFTSIHREHYGKPKSAQLVLNPGELLQLFKDLTIIEYQEDWHEGRHTARLWAQESSLLRK